MSERASFLQPIRQNNVVDEIIARFKQALMDGEFLPGQKLPSEPDLADRLGVGRSTVREALKILSALGAVEIKRGDGTYVSAGVDDSVIDPLLIALLVESGSSADLHEFRHMLEVAYCKLAAAKATPDDFARLQAIIDAMAAYVAEGGADPAALAQYDLQFHHTVVAATHNPLITKLGAMLNTMFAESLKQANATADGREWTLARHRKLLAVLRERDVGAVEEVITTSLDGWKRVVN